MSASKRVNFVEFKGNKVIADHKEVGSFEVCKHGIKFTSELDMFEKLTDNDFGSFGELESEIQCTFY